MTISSVAFQKSQDTATRGQRDPQLSAALSEPELSPFYEDQPRDTTAISGAPGPDYNVLEGERERKTVPAGHAQNTRVADERERLRRQDVILLPHEPSFESIDRPSFVAIQEWEGHVIDVADTTFLARLTDLNVGAERAEEEVQLLISDLSDDDRAMLAVGRVFRWAIGYQRSPGGSKRRVSQIVFRRLPQWTRKELDLALAEGRAIVREIQWD
jgi:hypothetical protein